MSRSTLLTRGGFALVAAALLAGACSDSTPSGPAPGAPSGLISKNRQPSPIVVAVTGALSDGGTFVGQATVQRFDYVNGQLTASGVLDGTATTIDGVAHAITGQAFTAPAALTSQGHGASPSVSLSRVAAPGATAPMAQTAGGCSILVLDIGAIHLDLLGLVVDLNQVHLTIPGQTGPGTLLGTLLCGLANALNGNQAGGIAGLLNRLLGL